MPVGREAEARAAAERHQHLLTLDARIGSGVFNGWRWWRGGSRVVWLPPDGEIIYKFEVAYHGSNGLEAENMERWRLQGHPWAPETHLFEIDGAEVLAMPYFTERIESSAEIPEDARRLVPDQNIENFRRRYDGQVMAIDAGDDAPL